MNKPVSQLEGVFIGAARPFMVKTADAFMRDVINSEHDPFRRVILESIYDDARKGVGL